MDKSTKMKMRFFLLPVIFSGKVMAQPKRLDVRSYNHRTTGEYAMVLRIKIIYKK